MDCSYHEPPEVRITRLQWIDDPLLIVGINGHLFHVDYDELIDGPAGPRFNAAVHERTGVPLSAVIDRRDWLERKRCSATLRP